MAINVVRLRIWSTSWLADAAEDLTAPAGPARASTAARPRQRAGSAGGKRARRPKQLRPAAAGGALSTPGMGDRLGVEVPWRKRWC
jgi:hypothetical protein